MRISLNFQNAFISRTLFALMIALCLLLPSKGFTQDDPIIEDANTQELPVTSGSVNSSTNNWLNSVEPTPETITPNPNYDETGSAASSGRPPSVAQRPGSTLDAPTGGDPGGNPDVPFDENMNIAFLAVGIVFAFYFVRKRFSSKVANAKP